MSETPEEPQPTVVQAADLDAAVAAVRTAIRAGECVVLPTDTVYGIAADAFAPAAVQRLLDAKRRGRDMPPPVLIADAAVLDALVRDVPESVRVLADRYWPGPVTLILTAQPSLRMDLGETRGSIGVRVPDHDVTRAILRATGPLAVSSANVSGDEPGTDVDTAMAQLGSSVSVYVDAGSTPGSVPSTIVDFATDPLGHVVRVGVVSVEELRELVPSLTYDEAPAPDAEPEASGDDADSAEPGSVAIETVADEPGEEAVPHASDEPDPPTTPAPSA